jgi:hypothetical protein
MPQLLLSFCLGLLPSLIVALVIIRKVNGESELLRERLAAEEASKRHFRDLANRLEITVEKMHQVQNQLVSENTAQRTRIAVTEATADAA